MGIEEVNEILFSQAKALKMCDNVHRVWYGKTLDVKELMDLFYRNLDFCIDNRWPKRETLSLLFEKDTLRKNGIIADDKWSLLNATNAVIMGDSETTARYNGFSVGKIYVFDNSSCNVTVKGHARAVIHAYDNAKVSVVAENGSHAIVLRHSRQSSCSCMGQTTIKECV